MTGLTRLTHTCNHFPIRFASLVGISSAQATLRNHAGSLEAQLANREYSLGQLSSQTANVLAEKLAEDEAVGRKVCC